MIGEYKAILVKPGTHNEIKTRAFIHKLTLDNYLNRLLQLEEKALGLKRAPDLTSFEKAVNQKEV